MYKCYGELKDTEYLLLYPDFGDIGPVAAQDLSNILKQGHLEKKRRGTAEHRNTSFVCPEKLQPYSS